MEAKDLRLFNFISNNGTICNAVAINDDEQVSVLGKSFYFTLNIEELQPIPLTEEWLLEFGFEKSNKMFDYFSRMNYWIFTLDSITFYMHEKCNVENKNYPHIKNVHQLQNLYFALTNEELTIKN